MFNQCPNEQVLQRYYDNEILSSDQRADVAAHLKECDLCSQTIRVWARHGRLLREALAISKKIDGKEIRLNRNIFARSVVISAVAASIVLVIAIFSWFKLAATVDINEELITYAEAEEYFGFQEALLDIYGEEDEGGVL